MHQALGEALHDLGEAREAIAAYEQAARLAPGKALNQYKLAGAYRSARRLLDARTAYLEALRLEPDHVAAAFELGQVQLWLDAPEETSRALELATRLRPQPDDLWYWHATTLWVLGRREEAEAVHARLLQINVVTADRLRKEIDSARRSAP